MNYVDIGILVLILLFALWGYFRGALKEATDIVVLSLSVLLAATLFRSFSQLIPPMSIIPTSFMLSMSFFCLFFVSVLFFYILVLLVRLRLPIAVTESPWNNYLGPILAATKTVLVFLLLFPVVLVLPFDNAVQKQLDSSLTARVTAATSKYVTRWIDSNFTDSMGTGKGFISLNNSTKAELSLGYSVSSATSDTSSAKRMMKLANTERDKSSAEDLAWDALIAKVAEARAKEIAASGVLSHTNKSGKSYLDQLTDAGTTFKYGSEIVAVGKDVDSISSALVSEDSDKAIIDSPILSRVGAAVVNLGTHGVLVVMEFTD